MRHDGGRFTFDLSGQRALGASVRTSPGRELEGDLTRLAGDARRATARSVFDLKAPQPRRDLGLTDRQITDIAWEEHLAEKFGGS